MRCIEKKTPKFIANLCNYDCSLGHGSTKTRNILQLVDKHCNICVTICVYECLLNKYTKLYLPTVFGS